MRNNKSEKIALTLLRIAIGWLFFHEGINKLITEGWTAKMYLLQSNGPLQSLYHWIVSNESILQFTNYSLIVALTLIGLALIIGLYERFFTIAGIIILALFYFAYPPWGELINNHTEGNYLLVDKNMITACALLALFHFNIAKEFGLDRFRFKPNN
ncbi:DoxX family membrane protein [Carboxylicivirga mesophila]|uniref:DoxX family membrane protein n=1 Tax=Carboxylicivirga mesophila TaxID=1166478 RepID=A0ABS5KCW5_9BACT|nr:DoxX family membrane protein [Carboxylicivirga mesophila]MBS2212830.1 DoxX family membrane protein [Carboxylicivirga mesophila]